MLNNLHYVKELGLRSRESLLGNDSLRFGEIMHEHWEHKKKRSGGMSRFSSVAIGGSLTLIARTTLGQSMSTSRIPTALPSWARVVARLTATVVLPTPPLPE